MANFEKAIPTILKWEGGFVDHPADPGGATNRGIIFSLFKQYAKMLGLLPDITGLKALTEDQAKKIYKIHFWDKMLGNQFKSQNVAEITFDAFVNCGNNGIKITQRAAGVEADGIIGKNSIGVINGADPKLLYLNIKDGRIAYYKNLAERKPSLQVFLKGWLNRANSFNFNPNIETGL